MAVLGLAASGGRGGQVSLAFNLLLRKACSLSLLIVNLLLLHAVITMSSLVQFVFEATNLLNYLFQLKRPTK